VYIPLGGNRKGKARQILNLLAVWALTGLWHGASWNFVLWGLFYGILVVLEKAFLGKWLARVPAFFAHLYLMFSVVLGWVLFYFTDFSRLGIYLKTMFGLNDAALADMNLRIGITNNIFWLILAVISCFPIFPALGKLARKHPALETCGQFARLVFSVLLLFVSTAMLVGQSYNPFLYYRF
jgi:alginate O-acetyltransferase complex protein AlgI